MWGGNTLRGQLVQPLHFCGFVDVAEVAKEKDMRMVERKERRRAKGKDDSCLVLFLLIGMS